LFLRIRRYLFFFHPSAPFLFSSVRANCVVLFSFNLFLFFRILYLLFSSYLSNSFNLPPPFVELGSAISCLSLPVTKPLQLVHHRLLVYRHSKRQMQSPALIRISSLIGFHIISYIYHNHISYFTYIHPTSMKISFFLSLLGVIVVIIVIDASSCRKKLMHIRDGPYFAVRCSVRRGGFNT